MGLDNNRIEDVAEQHRVHLVGDLLEPASDDGQIEWIHDASVMIKMPSAVSVATKLRTRIHRSSPTSKN